MLLAILLAALQGVLPPASPAVPDAPHPVYGPGPTDQERAVIQSFLNSPSPQLREEAIQMMQAIRRRMLTPIEYDAVYNASTGVTTYIPKVPGQGPVQVVGPPPGFRPPAPIGGQYDASKQPQEATGANVPHAPVYELDPHVPGRLWIGGEPFRYNCKDWSLIRLTDNKRGRRATLKGEASYPPPGSANYVALTYACEKRKN